MENSTMNFTIESDAFEPFRTDFNCMLAETLDNMVNKGTEEAIVNAKFKIKLSRLDKVDEMGNVHDVVCPSVIHAVRYAMKVEGNVVGGLQGDWELVTDDKGRYGLRPIDDGQISIEDLEEKDE